MIRILWHPKMESFVDRLTEELHVVLPHAPFLSTSVDIIPPLRTDLDELESTTIMVFPEEYLTDYYQRTNYFSRVKTQNWQSVARANLIPILVTRKVVQTFESGHVHATLLHSPVLLVQEDASLSPLAVLIEWAISSASFIPLLVTSYLYSRSPYGQTPGLSTTETTLLEDANEEVLQNDDEYHFNVTRTWSKLRTAGISEQQILEAYNRLGKLGLVTQHATLGGSHPHSLRFSLTALGMETYQRLRIESYSKIVQQVTREIVAYKASILLSLTNRNTIRMPVINVSEEIGASLQFPVLLVNHVLTMLSSAQTVQFFRKRGNYIGVDRFAPSFVAMFEVTKQPPSVSTTISGPITQNTPSSTRTVKGGVLIFHHDKDEKYAEELVTHLKPSGMPVSVFEERTSNNSSDRLSVLRSKLSQSEVIVLLVSHSLLGSEIFVSGKLKESLDEVESEGLSVQWVPVRASMYEVTFLASYQALYDPSTPLDGLEVPKRGSAFVEISKRLTSAYEGVP